MPPKGHLLEQQLPKFKPCTSTLNCALPQPLHEVGFFCGNNGGDPISMPTPQKSDYDCLLVGVFVFLPNLEAR